MEAAGRLAATVALLTVLAVATPLASAGPSRNAASKASQVVGYFIEWGIYGRNFKVKDVKTSGSADKLTVINYAFGNVAPDSSRISTRT
jgi:chitinase